MRLRFAPSPTGFLHIGNVRTAICNFIIAKKYNAPFILRIEDTDMERSSVESEKSILEDLRWLGIEWDEGPDIGGDYGPYRQSERFDIYKEYTERLINEGKAYYCYCTQGELERMRLESVSKDKSFIYPGKCKNLSQKEKNSFISEQRKPSVRFKLPADEFIVVNDLIKGRVSFDSENIGGDFIIVRSDGVPIYNYIVIIDDALMEITHVIRGEDHLSNTPKQILIAKALNLPIPEYAHHALVLGPDRSKLSKRHGITSVQTYKREGYLPNALVNYLIMLGWATESGEEILPFDEIIKEIEIENLSKSASIFDFQKLRWMNSHYIRNEPLDEISSLLIPYIKEAGYNFEGLDMEWLDRVINLLRGYCEILSDIKNLISIFIEDVPEPDENTNKLFEDEDSKSVIKEAYRLINSEINEENISADLIKGIKKNTSIKGKKLFLPVRGILTGRLQGPELDQAIPLIGYNRCKKRIEYTFKKYIQ